MIPLLLARARALTLQTDAHRQLGGPDPDFRCAPISKVWDSTGLYEQAGIVGNGATVYPTQYDRQKYYPGFPAEADLKRPVREIRTEHAGADLFGYFGELNDWINPGSQWDPKTNYERIKPGFLGGGGPRDPNGVK